MSKITSAIGGFFGAIGRYFADFGKAMAKGDIFVKLSLIWWGAGYIARKQYVKGIIMTLLEAGIILFSIFFAPQYVSKFGTLGTVQFEQVFDVNTMQMVPNDYDHSFLILLFSLFCFVVWTVTFFICISVVKNAYRLQLRAQSGGHINSFKDDIADYFDKKFHVTLLSLPVLGIVIFTVIPILLLVFVAFTNYDQYHMPPAALFTWVGFDNFKSLFTSGGLTVSFSYAFGRILGWTLVWAFFATFTTYFGGILMSLLLNSKKTVVPKLWRLLLVITIAVPQFVSLLLVRYFFANNGIVNTICQNIGLTGLLRNWGLINTTYIPFLTAPIWAHVTIIIINIWIGVPYQMLVATGILMNLPSDQLESARIDGANKFQVFRYITMPYMFQVTAPTLVTDFVKNINNFNVIFLLTDGVYTTTNQMMANSQAKETDLLITWLFNLTQNYYNYKMAAVIGIVVFLICAVFTLIAFNFLISGDKEGVYN